MKRLLFGLAPFWLTVTALGLALVLAPVWAGEEEKSAKEKSVSIEKDCAVHLTIHSLNQKPFFDYDESITLCKEAMIFQSKTPLAYVSLANTYEGRKNLDSAAFFYKLALELEPNMAMAHYRLGEIYREQQLWDAAIASFKKALHLKERWKVSYSLGDVYRRTGQTDAAFPWFKEALKIKPDFAHAHLGLGLSYAVKDEEEPALASLRTALKLNPRLGDAHLGICGVYSKSDKLDKAINFCNTVIRLNPKSPMAYLFLGVVYSLKMENSLAADYLYKSANLFLEQGNRKWAVYSYDKLRGLESPLADKLFKKLYP